MGFAKRQMMEEDEQGWAFSSQSVCQHCVDDDALKSVLAAAGDGEAACDFCGSSPASALDILLDTFVKGLRTEYEDAAAGVFYESREGGYQWDPKWDTWELVGLFDDVLVGDGLLDTVSNAMHDRTWVEYNFAHPRRDQALLAGWERFCEAVKYETRYVFWLRDDEDAEQIESWGEVPASRILQQVGDLVDRMGLIQSLPKGYRLWRGRSHELGVAYSQAHNLGTAPRDKATRGNRMNPAGIPMFYGAADMRTAAMESLAHTGDPLVSLGQFETSEPGVVVDFTSLEQVPSLFDLDRSPLRRPLMFLHRFVQELSLPAREEYEEIDYVPTQVLSEYLLRIFRPGVEIAGLLYRSALSGELAAVLDVSHDRCVEQTSGWTDRPGLGLGLVPNSARTIDREVLPSKTSV
ncbi:MAG: HEPN-associated N-terminal domain-containing protein [Actinomycetota bacterium]|nr:HEPN-associated N-terminal domain-containing protein [Actinomycetota bacterium]